MATMSVEQLEELGRTQLSKSFFMREFLYSEISQVHSIPNIPDDPDLAIAAGKRLCEEVLEPIQDRLGRISIRSAYRSTAVNALGAANKSQYRCAADNAACHTWDVGERGFMGATACVVVTSFLPYYEKSGDWTALAWWIHEHVPAYADMEFFPKLAAFNIRWFEDPGYKKSISTFVKNPHTGSKQALVLNGEPRLPGPYERFYKPYLETLAGQPVTDSSSDRPAMEPVVIVRVGASGGDVTLFGQERRDGSWRFKRKTVDQTEMLLGDADTSWHSESGWVDGWEAALQQLDRYPWAMLHPLEVHPEFRSRVQLAISQRHDRAAQSRQVERVREKWRVLLDGRED